MLYKSLIILDPWPGLAGYIGIIAPIRAHCIGLADTGAPGASHAIRARLCGLRRNYRANIGLAAGPYSWTHEYHSRCCQVYIMLW